MAAGPHDLLREYARLDRSRREDAITPLEYQRWLDLRQRLQKLFPSRPAPGNAGTSRIRIDFETRRELRRAVMREVRPVGFFAATPFGLEEGETFQAVVHVAESGERFEGPVVVVSENVGPGYSTATLGMGLRFATADCPLRSALERLCAATPRLAHERPRAAMPAGEQQANGKKG